MFLSKMLQVKGQKKNVSHVKGIAQHLLGEYEKNDYFAYMSDKKKTTAKTT